MKDGYRKCKSLKGGKSKEPGSSRSAGSLRLQFLLGAQRLEALVLSTSIHLSNAFVNTSLSEVSAKPRRQLSQLTAAAAVEHPSYDGLFASTIEGT